MADPGGAARPRRRARAGVDRARARSAPPSFLAAYTFHFRQKTRLDEAALKAQLTLAGYSHVSQVVPPGEYAVRGGLIDLFPMGSPVPYRVDLFGDEVDSIRTFDPDSAAQPAPGARRCACCRAASSRSTRRRARPSRALAREDRGRPEQVRLYRTSARASPAAASSTTCRCSSSRRRRCSTTSAAAPRWRCTARSTPRCSASGPTPAKRHRFLQHDRERPILPPEELFLRPEEFFARPASPRSSLCAGAARRPGRARCRPERRSRRARAAAAPAAARRHDAAPRARRRRERRPAREPARAAARQPHRAAERGVARRVRGRRRALTRSPWRRLAEGFFWLEPRQGSRRSSSSPRPSSSPPPGRMRRRRKRSRRPGNALIKDLQNCKIGEPRWCTPTTASDATPAWKTMETWAVRRVPARVPTATGCTSGALLQFGSRFHTGAVSAEEAPLHWPRLEPMGQGAASAPPSRCATSPPNCSTYASPQGAREGFAFAARRIDYEVFRGDAFGFEETPDQQARPTP